MPPICKVLNKPSTIMRLSREIYIERIRKKMQYFPLKNLNLRSRKQHSEQKPSII